MPCIVDYASVISQALLGIVGPPRSVVGNAPTANKCTKRAQLAEIHRSIARKLRLHRG